MVSARRSSKAEYAAAREELLGRIRRGLAADVRFRAAWLGGSYGRGAQDAVSDIDLFAVVDGAYAADLCARGPLQSAGSPPARAELFARFGEAANIHENHANAPAGGTFSAVLYRVPPVIVDWTLLPDGAARPEDTRLLFERGGGLAGAPAASEPPEEHAAVSDSEVIASRLAEPAGQNTERGAFFWMMAAVTAKYIVRGEPGSAIDLLGFLERVAAELAELYGLTPCREAEILYPDRAAQTTRLRELCTQIAGIGVDPSPMAQVAEILSLE